jgi:hypothetical protein
MEDDKLCACGSAANWKEIGSTWMCVACRDRDVRKNIAELKEALAQMRRAEGALRMFDVGTKSIPELLSRLTDEIDKVEMDSRLLPRE